MLVDWGFFWIFETSTFKYQNILLGCACSLLLFMLINYVHSVKKHDFRLLNITTIKLWFLIAPYLLNLSTILHCFLHKKKYLEFQTLFLFLANQIVMRAAFLEDENGKLKKEVDETINTNTIIRNDVTFLSKRLSQYQCNRHPQTTAIM